MVSKKLKPNGERRPKYSQNRDSLIEGMWSFLLKTPRSRANATITKATKPNQVERGIIITPINLPSIGMNKDNVKSIYRED